MRALIAFLSAWWLVSCASETIDDRRYGQQLVCHDGRKTLTVSSADNLVHLGHGDTPGPCAQDSP